MNATTYYTTMSSPIDDILLISDGESLTGLYMDKHAHDGATVGPDWRRDAGPFREVERQLGAYFAGDLRTFDLPIALHGTDFQQVVWQALREIGPGERVSYGELARRIGRPAASRAVGLANGRNPVSIVVPCHRVVGANGSLTGYGGGLPRKKWLLEHEAKLTAR